MQFIKHFQVQQHETVKNITDFGHEIQNVIR